MRKIQRRDFLKAMGLATAALGLTACGGSGAASASSVSSAPASSSSAPSASAQPESAVDKAAPAGAPVTQFQTGELTIGEYTFKAQYIPFESAGNWTERITASMRTATGAITSSASTTRTMKSSLLKSSSMPSRTTG